MNCSASTRLAGVRISYSGPIIFVQAADLPLSTGDEVLVQLTGEEVQAKARVAIAPDQLVSTAGIRSAGRVAGKPGTAQGPKEA